MTLENSIIKQELIKNEVKTDSNIKQKVKIKRKRVTNEKNEKNENIKEFKIPEFTEYENVTNKLYFLNL